MNGPDVHVFDVYGDWGFFRRYFSTSSPVTFAAPPRTTLLGMLAALMELYDGRSGRQPERPDFAEHYLTVLTRENCRLAVQPLVPLMTDYVGINLVNTKDGAGLSPGKPYKNNTQVGFELLRQPAYRIYAALEEPWAERLGQTLAEHRSGYTLSLGLAGLLANYRYLGRHRTREQAPQGPEEINSAVTADSLNRAEPEHSREHRWVKQIMAMEMKLDREVTAYEPVFVSISPLEGRRQRQRSTWPPTLIPEVAPLKCKPKLCWEIELPQVGSQRFTFLDWNRN